MSDRPVLAQRVNGEIPPQTFPPYENEVEVVCALKVNVEILTTVEIANIIINRRETILK